MKSKFMALFAKLFLGTSFLVILATANAQSTDADAAKGDDVAVVKYLGAQDDMLVFDITYSNPTGGKFLVTIKDQDGNSLYQNLFNEKSIYKQFRLPKPEKDRIVFVIRDYRNADIVRAFDINVNSRVIHEVAVRKVN
ncbi:hypothetical protein [Puia sp.]|jgi:hypothetical protein|uniref:hypothetical protein n=1 Tax=Puia sp. TaxID=2045100 RepID=UPI002F40655D